MSAIITRPSRGNWYARTPHDALEAVVNSRSFQHLSKSVILGFIEFHIETQFGQFKDQFVPAHWETKKCSKCKGRGWFGRGKPECTKCGGKGKTTKHHVDSWICKTKINEAINHTKIAFLNAAMHDWKVAKKTTRGRRIAKINECLHSKKDIYPKWVKQIIVPDNLGISEKEAKSLIKEALAVKRHSPSIKIPCFEHWENAARAYAYDEWQLRHSGFYYMICTNALMQRLARKFGTTCPVTGEFAHPRKYFLARIVSEQGAWTRASHPDAQLPHPWGVPCPMRDSRTMEGNRAVRHSLSEKGQKLIARAKKKWQKDFEEAPPDEWLMAEIMQRQLIPQAQKAKLAA